MRASLEGDVGKLVRHSHKIKQIPSEVRAKLSLQLAEEAIELVRDGMARGVDPYGKHYAPLKFRSGRPLRKTGRMGQWFRKRSDASGFTIASPASYAIYHQIGTGIYGPKKRPIKPVKAKALRIPTPGGAVFRKSVKGTPRRAMVPYRKALSPAWRRAFREVTNEVLHDHFDKP